MATAIKDAPLVAVAPFGLEADTRNNGDILLRNIPGCRLRGRISPAKVVKNVKTGDEMIPNSRARMSILGEIPGMELHLNPAKCTYKVRDPLHGDDELCDKIANRMRKLQEGGGPGKLRGIPPLSGSIDRHDMKTLLRELLCHVESNNMRLIRGTMPAIEDIDSSPGKYLLNPGSETLFMMPRFEEDWDKWVAQLTSFGS